MLPDPTFSSCRRSVTLIAFQGGNLFCDGNILKCSDPPLYSESLTIGEFFNRPGGAGAVLQRPPLLIN